MKNAGTVLLYNCSGPEFSKLRQIFAMLRLRMRVVEPGKYHLTIGELAQGKGDAIETDAQPIPENMLVFCNLGNALLNQVLEVIRVAGLPPIALKAVMTQTNQNWDSNTLYQDLVKERETIAAQQKK